MIKLPPQVVERDGREVVVDQDGYELVLRSRSRARNSRTYHASDPDAARDGVKKPYCKFGQQAIPDATDLLWRRRQAIEATWSRCKYCADDDGPGGNGGGTDLAQRLRVDDSLKEQLENELEQGGRA